MTALKKEPININEFIPDDMTLLVEIVGTDKAIEVIKAYEGTSLYFNKNISREIEKAGILQELESGIDYKTVARKHGYTETWIRNIHQEYFYKKRTEGKEKTKNLDRELF